MSLLLAAADLVGCTVMPTWERSTRLTLLCTWENMSQVCAWAHGGATVMLNPLSPDLPIHVAIQAGFGKPSVHAEVLC